MDKKPLIGVSICVVVILVLASLSNVVGYQTVQSSNQAVITNEVNPRELVFQTILDVANNREIQKVVSDSEMQNKGFFAPQVLTKKYLNTAYRIGLILTKVLGVNRIQSLIQRHQITTPEMQKEITDVIERNTTLKMEMMQLSSVSCGCDSENTILWNFPIICTFLLPLFIISYALYLHNQDMLWNIMQSIGSTLNCSWVIH